MKKRRGYIAWTFLAPSLILYLYLFVYPAINAFRISFYKWSGFVANMEFVGFNNFSKLISDTSFLGALKNTLLLLTIGGIGTFLLAFIFSFLLGSGIRGKKVYRTIIFFPYIIAPVVLSVYWGLLVYNPRVGILNQFFKLLHIEVLSEFVFTDMSHIFWSALFVVIWSRVGFYLILLMAGIERIPPCFYEAARLEGATELQIFFKITLPLIKEVLMIAIIFWGINAIKMFELFYAFGGILPPRALWTNAIYLYIMGFGKRDPIFQLGYASAIGVATFLLIIIFSFIIRGLVKKEIYEY
jgi:ABC-type sugar transport system permease subunit